jgi:hypothetical protein
MVIHNVKPIVVGVAFFFIDLIAGAPPDDAKTAVDEGFRGCNQPCWDYYLA